MRKKSSISDILMMLPQFPVVQIQTLTVLQTKARQSYRSEVMSNDESCFLEVFDGYWLIQLNLDC